MTSIPKIHADWDAPAGIVAFTTTRAGGVSKPPWQSLNLGSNCGDEQAAVTRNREILATELPAPPDWLRQEHGSRVVRAGSGQPRADAVWTDSPGQVCAVLTADCLPVLLCERNGQRLAAVHCGWRSLAGGVLENTLRAMGAGSYLAWLGPAISAACYEVGKEVYAAFCEVCPGDEVAFQETRPGHWWVDLSLLASRRLRRLGVTEIRSANICNYTDQRFYSYRRDGRTGRMATLVYRQE